MRPSPPSELPRLEWIRIVSGVLAALGGFVFVGIVLRDDRISGQLRVMINEQRAIESLEKIAEAQSRFAHAVAVDANGDGVGEYGFFSDLSGRGHLRNGESASAGRARTTSNSGAWLPERFHALVDDGFGNGVVETEGYRFRMFLPGELTVGKFPGVTELAESGALGFEDEVDPAAAAEHWCVYAWPVEAGVTGQRVFFVNEANEVRELGNPRGRYTGAAGVTTFGLAYSAPSMDAALPTPALEPGTAWTTVDPAGRHAPAASDDTEPLESPEASEEATPKSVLELIETRFQELTPEGN